MKRFIPLAVILVLLALLLIFVAPFTVNAQSHTWDSYNNQPRENPDETFEGNEHTIYMQGTGYATLHIYKIGYYDGSGEGVHEDAVVTLTGTIESEYNFPNDQSTVAGTWHSVVFDTAGAIADNWTDAQTDPNNIASDDFTGLCISYP